MSAAWPTSVATDANLYLAVNELQTNLSSGVNAAVATLTLNSTTSFPAVGLVLIDNEVIKYTGVSGSDLTGCTRGFDGTTAASHSAGAVVSFAICAAHHNALKDEVIAVETSLNLTASKAVATNASGRLVAATTTDTELGYVAGVTSALQTQLNAKAADSAVVHNTGTESVAGAKTFSTQLIGKGTATNDSPAAGYIGEVISGSLTRTNNAALTTATPLNVVSISLTAGDWDVRGLVGFTLSGGTSVSRYDMAISTTSATLPGGDTLAVPDGAGQVRAELSLPAGIPGGGDTVICVPSVRVSLSSTTTYYLVAQSTFTVAGNGAYGSISARRVR